MKKKGIVLFAIFILFSLNFVFAAPIIIDHNAVDDFENIPDEYIIQAKKMWLNFPGESHSSGYRIGVQLLAQQNPEYAAVISTSSPTPYREDALRVSGLVRTQYSSWGSGAGEAIWYANGSLRSRIKNHIDYCNNNNLIISAIGFGWCWDMTWQNAPGGGLDTIFDVHWAGSSDGGPQGNLRWGLDAEDTALTGNTVNMDTYLGATEEYSNHAESQGYGTKVMFTTGPVDGYTGENGYQREIKHEYIRNFVENSEDRILFDYADILSYNDSGNENRLVWNGNNYQQIHPDNMKDLNGGYVEDGDHIGQIGAVRLAKAEWYLAARLAGWDGGIAAEENCSDGIQNGDEVGVDCGGSCLDACFSNISNNILLSVWWQSADTETIIKWKNRGVDYYVGPPSINGVWNISRFTSNLNAQGMRTFTHASDFSAAWTAEGNDVYKTKRPDYPGYPTAKDDPDYEGFSGWLVEPDEPDLDTHMIGYTDSAHPETIDEKATVDEYVRRVEYLENLSHATLKVGGFAGNDLSYCYNNGSKNRRTFTNLSWNDFENMAAQLDVVYSDYYPVNIGQNLDSLISRIVATSAVANGKPFVIAIETSDQHININGRAPTPGEVRAETWLALIYGAKAILYFPQAPGGQRLPIEIIRDDNTPADVSAELAVQNELIKEHELDLSLSGIVENYGKFHCRKIPLLDGTGDVKKICLNLDNSTNILDGKSYDAYEVKIFMESPTMPCVITKAYWRVL